MSEYKPLRDSDLINKHLVLLRSQIDSPSLVPKISIARVMADIAAAKGGEQWAPGIPVELRGSLGIRFELDFIPSDGKPENYNSVSLAIPKDLGLTGRSRFALLNGIEFRWDEGRWVEIVKTDPDSGDEAEFDLSRYRAKILVEQLHTGFDNKLIPY